VASAEQASSLRALALAALALGSLAAGCGSSGRSTAGAGHASLIAGGSEKTGGSGKSPASANLATPRPEGLTATLKATPTPAGTGTPVELRVTAGAARAPGTFGYQVRFGDGTNAAQSSASLICDEARRVPMHQTWHLTHRYRAPGRYTVSVTVYTNCNSDRARATVAIDVTAAAAS
jgi:PKD domain